MTPDCVGHILIGKADFIACSGARIWYVNDGGPGTTSGGGGGGDGQPKESQASQLEGTNPELVTLSIGGNNMGSSDLLDRVCRIDDRLCV
jgi:hypothetical protein